MIKNILSDRSPHRLAVSALFLFTALIILYSCDRNRIYENNKSIEGSCWKDSSILKFNVEITDKELYYNFYLNIRINNEYKYANLFLFMKTLYPSGQVSSDTIECYFADTEGRWLGKYGGSIIDNRILLRKNLKFSTTGLYSFEFEQAMRQPELCSVEDFGIRIEKTEQP